MWEKNRRLVIFNCYLKGTVFTRRVKCMRIEECLITHINIVQICHLSSETMHCRSAFDHWVIMEACGLFHDKIAIIRRCRYLQQDIRNVYRKTRILQMRKRMRRPAPPRIFWWWKFVFINDIELTWPLSERFATSKLDRYQVFVPLTQSFFIFILDLIILLLLYSLSSLVDHIYIRGSSFVLCIRKHEIVSHYTYSGCVQWNKNVQI